MGSNCQEGDGLDFTFFTLDVRGRREPPRRHLGLHRVFGYAGVAGRKALPTSEPIVLQSSYGTPTFKRRAKPGRIPQVTPNPRGLTRESARRVASQTPRLFTKATTTAISVRIVQRMGGRTRWVRRVLPRTRGAPVSVDKMLPRSDGRPDPDCADWRAECPYARVGPLRKRLLRLTCDRDSRPRAKRAHVRKIRGDDVLATRTLHGRFRGSGRRGVSACL